MRQKLPVSNQTFFTPGNALQLQFVNGNKGSWHAKVFQHVARGQDIIKESKWLSLHINVTSQNTTAEQLPGIQLLDNDSNSSKLLALNNYVTLSKTNQWQQVLIPLKAFTGLIFKRSIDITGVAFIQNSNDGNKHNIYIDDIELLSDTLSHSLNIKPVIVEAKVYAKHVDISWKPLTDTAIKWIKIYRSANGKDYVPVGTQSPMINRYADFVNETGKAYHYKISFLNNNYDETSSSNIVSASTKAMTDDDLLTMVQEASFRYYWEGEEPNSGLARENIPGRQQMIASGASGFGLMALLVGTERQFITRQQSVERFLKIISFLEKTETFHGAFSHFIDGPSKKVEPFFGNRDNGGDLVETSFLMQGLLAARAYFNKDDNTEKQIRERITKLWQNVEWNWYRKKPEDKFLTWHWSPDQAWVINHQLIGWNETMITYLLAIASPTHSVPATLYYSGWANQEEKGKSYRKGWGQTADGSNYTNGNTYYGIPLAVGVSNGGPLFFTHYSYVGYDPHNINDKYTNYFTNNQNISLINYNYCVENPGKYVGYSDSCWGLTASDGPYNYSADEPVLRQDKGKIAPTGAISSFPYTPEQSMKALKNYYYNYGKFLWGEYGFKDAFNLTENWCSDIYMGLNQAPMVVMIENYRTGLIWKYFMQDKDVKSGLEKLAANTPSQK